MMPLVIIKASVKLGKKNRPWSKWGRFFRLTNNVSYCFGPLGIFGRKLIVCAVTLPSVFAEPFMLT